MASYQRWVSALSLGSGSTPAPVSSDHNVTLLMAIIYSGSKFSNGFPAQLNPESPAWLQSSADLCFLHLQPFLGKAELSLQQ